MSESKWTIFYNPKCGSCRKALDLLKRKKLTPTIVEYLKTPPVLETLESILSSTGLAPQDIVRRKEKVFETLDLKDTSSRKEWLQAIVKHPILLQRPIILHGSRGVVARPPEKVEELF